MLYRYLLPELDTGPWTRKSSTLCSLLLLLATLFVLEVTGKEEIVGPGGHTLKDGKVELNKALIDLGYIYTGVKNLNVPGYNESLIPISCNITITEDFIKLNYDGTPCTIELLSDFKDKIEFKAGVRTGGKSDCLDSGDKPKHGSNNTLLFIYSRSNSDINEFISNKGPPLQKDKTCSKDCEDHKGSCTKWTSYEVSWSKGRKGKKYAHTSLINDISSSSKELDVGDEVTFNLEIVKDYRKTLFDPAGCAPEKDPIGAPPVLTITNTHLEGNYLLVFGLLPPGVDRPPKPKCDLSIQFDSTRYQLFGAVLPPSAKTTTTTSTTTTTTKAESPPKTKKPETSTCPSTSEESGALVTWLLVVFGILSVVGLGGTLWYWMKTSEAKQQVDDLLQAKIKAEAKIEELDAALKENQKKNEKGAQAQEPPPDGKAASKKKPEEVKAKADEKIKSKQPPATKSAIGADKSVADSGKSTAGADDKKPKNMVIEMPRNADKSKTGEASFEDQGVEEASK